MLELNAEKLKLKVQKLQDKQSEFYYTSNPLMWDTIKERSAFWISSLFFLKKNKQLSDNASLNWPESKIFSF